MPIIMEDLTIRELCESIKKNAPWLLKHVSDADRFLLDRRPIELIMLAYEVTYSKKRTVADNPPSTIAINSAES